MRTPTTRRQHNRAGLAYETDLTDAEWAVIEPLMPGPAACGRPAVWTSREILNAIFYVLRGGSAGRLIPTDLPLRSTTFGSFIGEPDGRRDVRGGPARHPPAG